MESVKLGVVGIGTMGSGIAITALSAGLDVLVVDRDEVILRDGVSRIEKFFSHGVEKRKLTEEQRMAHISRLRTSTRLEDLAECGIIIEAVYEEMNAKRQIFSRLNAVCPEDTLFLTNTSTLSVTAIASGSGRPDRVVGMHFCNPAPLMKLVEISRGLQTVDASYQKAVDFAGILGKTPVTTKDTPGFILNLFLLSFNNDCLRFLESGAATAEDIDTAVRLGLGHPMGPFQLLDIVGMEIFETVSLSLYSQLKNARYAPPPLADRMIDAGWLGMKTGKGFYEYREKGMFGATQGAQQSSIGNLAHAEEETGIKKVGIIGCGTMGSGIAQVCAQKGLRVIVTEPRAALVKKGIQRISDFLSLGVKKGKLSQDEKIRILRRITGTTRLADLKACDLIVEAAFEDIDLKKGIFVQIGRIARSDAILATNTSCLSITEIASAAKNPERVLGLHFFNPVPLMKLVEVINGLETGSMTLLRGTVFVRSLGKVPVACKDNPGFIVNRLLCPYLNQVIQAYDDGLATKEDIDLACELGLGHPMGPLKLLDLIGLDVHFNISRAMYDFLHEEKYSPPPLLRKMVLSGHLGRKSGRGFYAYGKA